jgi:hypothetical protein
MDLINVPHLPGKSRINSISCTCELWIWTNCSEHQAKRDLSFQLHVIVLLGKILSVEISTNYIVDHWKNNHLLRLQCSSSGRMVSYKTAPLGWLTTVIIANIYWVLFMWTHYAKPHLHVLIYSSQQPHVVGAIINLSVQVRNTRFRTINNLSRITYSISDCTIIIIITSPLVKQPTLQLRRQTIHSHFFKNFTREEMLPGLWVISELLGLNIHLLCSIFINFPLPQIITMQSLSTLWI